MKCDDCGKNIRKFHPYAHYDNVTLGRKVGLDKDDRIVEKNLCQQCAIPYIEKFRKYTPGKLFIE